MFQLIKKLLLFDGAVYVCILSLIFLIWRFVKTKDKDLKFFIHAISFYLLGEIANKLNKNVWLPIDFVFFFFFYLFLFMYIRHQTKVLLKNPVSSIKAKGKTYVVIVMDFFIMATFSYLIYFYFDRQIITSKPVFASINSTAISNFIYPVFDFILLGYYLIINKLYVIAHKKVTLPLVCGISVWTTCNFLFAYEYLFSDAHYGIGSHLTLLGLILLVIILILVKTEKQHYSTFEIYKENTKYNQINLFANGIVILYIALYIYCIIYIKNSNNLKSLLQGGIIMLLLIIARQYLISIENYERLCKLSKDATTDPLTGLFSRKYTFTLLKSLYKSSMFFNNNISVLMVDIDHFKEFNDTYGHISGDNVLKEIASLFKETIDKANIICRYGGEEFLIIMPGYDTQMGFELAEKIRENVENFSFDKNRLEPGKVTVSVGGASAGENTKKEIELIKQADSALYEAKAQRNKSIWYTVKQDKKTKKFVKTK